MTVLSIPLQAMPFVDDFVDVPELNEHVSTHVLERISSVREIASKGERSTSTATAVLGPAGGGKTHLLGRIRHVAGPNATLVLLRPYFGVSIGLRDVLAAIIDQLCRRPKGAVISQIDFVTAYWLAAEQRLAFPAASTLEARELTADAREALLEQAIARVIERIPELAPVAHLVRAILRLGTLAGAELWGELSWISGREPRSGSEGAVLGEGDILHVLSIVALLAAPVAPIALVFDQLENLATEGEERVLGYGNLVAELVDSVPCLTIVQLALTSEWLEFIEPRLSLAQRTRVAHDKIVLALPTENERRLLLRAWHARLVPPSSAATKRKRPTDPLSGPQVKELLGTPGMTPRMLAAAYARLLAGKPLRDPDTSGPERTAHQPVLSEIFESERIRVRGELEERESARLPIDATELAEGLAGALAHVEGLEVTTRSERERLLTHVRAPGGDLVIVYLTSSHHASVGAGLTRAAELARTTKVAIVREKRFALPASWATVEERRAAFERLPNARWLWLDREDAMRCLALARVASLARAKRLRAPDSEEPLTIEWVRARVGAELGPTAWPAVTSIARWLHDVPHDPGAPVDETAPRSRREPRRRENVADVRPSASPVTVSVPSATDERPPSSDVRKPRLPGEPLDSRQDRRPEPHPLHALRQWARTGRDIGKAVAAHYLGKLRPR